MMADFDAPVPSDACLVAAATGGDQEAFEVLIKRYERSARATCYSVLRDWHLAHDAAQEGFIAAYQALKGLRDPSSFGPWLITIMCRRANRMRRRKWLWSSLRFAHDVPAVPTGEPDNERLLRAVAALPEHERTVVLLRYFEGNDVATIATICGRPVGTVTKQLSRAHHRLQQALEKGSSHEQDN